MNDTTISRCRVVDQRYRPAVPGSARGANHLLAVALDHLTPSPRCSPPDLSCNWRSRRDCED